MRYLKTPHLKMQIIPKLQYIKIVMRVLKGCHRLGNKKNAKAYKNLFTFMKGVRNRIKRYFEGGYWDTLNES